VSVSPTPFYPIRRPNYSLHRAGTRATMRRNLINCAVRVPAGELWTLGHVNFTSLQFAPRRNVS